MIFDAAQTLVNASHYFQKNDIKFIVLLGVTQEADGAVSEGLKYITKKIETELTKNNIRYLSTLPLLESHDGTMKYRFENDGHWNMPAHKLVSDAISDYIGINELIK